MYTLNRHGGSGQIWKWAVRCPGDSSHRRGGQWEGVSSLLAILAIQYLTVFYYTVLYSDIRHPDIAKHCWHGMHIDRSICTVGTYLCDEGHWRLIQNQTFFKLLARRHPAGSLSFKYMASCMKTIIQVHLVSRASDEALLCWIRLERLLSWSKIK